jgi:RNA-directed DNA polymerase
VKARSFATTSDRNWVFSGGVRGPKGHPEIVRPFSAHGLPITRRAKIESKVNPFDPQWELYLEKRLSHTMAAPLQGRKTVLALWKRQHGRCPHCGTAIIATTGWHSHHMVWRSYGGSATVDNRVLRHPPCHYQVHRAHGSTCRPHPFTRVFGKA